MGEISPIEDKQIEASRDAENIKDKKPARSRIPLSNNRKVVYALGVVTLLLVVVMGGLVGYRYFSKSSTKSRYDQLLQTAADQHNNREYSAALSTYNDALVLDSTSQAAYVGVLNILLDKNLSNDAQEFVDGASQVLSGTELGDLYLMIAEHYFTNKKWDSAERNFAQADKLGSMNGNSIDQYAISSLNAGGDRWSSLVTSISNAELKSILKQYSDVTDAKGSTSLYERAKLSQKAINLKAYRVAVGLLEDQEDVVEYWDGLYFLGRAYYELGEYEKAGKYIDMAVLIAPDDTSLQLLAARNSVLMRKPSEALTHYDQYIIYSKEDEVELSVLGEYVELLIKERRYSHALDTLAKMKQSSDEIDLLKLKVLLAQGESAEITKAIDRMSSTMEPDSDAYYMYLWLSSLWYVEQGQFTKAEQVISQVDQSEVSDDPYYYYVMGRLINAKGDEKDADNYFKQAIEKDLDGTLSEMALKYVR